MEKTINKRKSSPVKGLNSSPQSPNTFIDLLDVDCVSFRFQNKSHMKKKTFMCLQNKQPSADRSVPSPCSVDTQLSEGNWAPRGVQTPACRHAFYF